MGGFVACFCENEKDVRGVSRLFGGEWGWLQKEHSLLSVSVQWVYSLQFHLQTPHPALGVMQVNL